MTALAEQVRNDAVRPALEALGLWSKVAENLVLGTFAHESGGFVYRRQIGGGPARGLGQIEKPTFDDIYSRYLGLRPVLMGKMDTLWPNDSTDPWLQVEHNDRFAAGICRIKYAMRPEKLPDDPNDVFEMSRLWKRIYNTPLGRGTPEQWIADYRRYVEDVPDKVGT